MAVRVQVEDFDVANEYHQLVADNTADGAVVSFVGRMRDLNQGEQVRTMTLEHYPGMTEKALNKLEADARQRWSLGRVSIIHRVGTLTPADQIVWVGVTSKHRGDAFAACEYIMDTLKTTAPFWKKESTAAGERWVDAREEDQQRSTRWL
ncbi:molybdopterin synthase catalytic subunit MoaE [Salinispirillum sp. LH 10-3-1]|uniref:Molybdopterin synthase catalytic subunit n=1 Tax=Salinispirillum sp. LH 10-3-1 TaxID=2952525 RepID=A0AB38YIZ1_9GAMM